MSTAVRVLRLRELMFALALVGALAGLVGMHHVLASGMEATPMPDGAPAMVVVYDTATVPESGSDMTVSRASGHGGHDGTGADLLHLCLAVLVGGVALAVALFVLRRSDVVSVLRALWTGSRATGPRAPPLPVPRRLALLCVLRT